MASRLLSDLTATLQQKARLFLQKCYENKLQVHITCTARSLQEQAALYAQGRRSLDEVNSMRLLCGLWALKESENLHPVTWTLSSLHVTCLDDEDINNDKARAFDVAIVKDGKFIWQLKADTNNDNLNDWEEIGEIGESCGLVWGGRWKNPDRPHFQEA